MAAVKSSPAFAKPRRMTSQSLRTLSATFVSVESCGADAAAAGDFTMVCAGALGAAVATGFGGPAAAGAGGGVGTAAGGAGVVGAGDAGTTVSGVDGDALSCAGSAGSVRRTGGRGVAGTTISVGGAPAGRAAIGREICRTFAALCASSSLSRFSVTSLFATAASALVAALAALAARVSV